VTSAFDLYTDRKLRYGIKNGAPDPATVEDDRRQLAKMVKETMESWHGRKVSPVYSLMPNLQEPDWKSLRIGDVREFWEKHDAWEDRVALARQAGNIGDVLVLANEAPVTAFRAAAWIRAGEALVKAKSFDFALEHLEGGLAIEPRNLKGLHKKGICLQRLALEGRPGHSLERARKHYRNMLKSYPNDSETWALLGRVDKDAWTTAWRQAGSTPKQMQKEARYEDALLRAAIVSYAKGYRTNPGHYYAGINALALMHVYRHLTGDTRYDQEMETMAGAVRFAAECETDESQLFWSKVTLGDLEVLVGTPASVRAAYKEAIAKNERDWFALDSSRAQLQILKDLGFRPEAVRAGISTFDRALKKLEKPKDQWQPRHVFLFSGHRIDAPDRAEPRFPAGKETAAAQRIAEALDELEASTKDMAISQAASGGDLLFLEACLKRGVRCRVHLPFNEPTFIEQSILPSTDGKQWRERYYAVKAKLGKGIRIMPGELGPSPSGVDSYERCNLWSLYTALAFGVDKVRFVCLWNGGGGDGPGGTAHMYNEVKERTGRVTWIDSREL
jgi:tetratricopeptide (TPR) repeat protein